MKNGTSRLSAYAAAGLVLAGVFAVSGTAAAQSAANTLRIANTVAAPNRGEPTAGLSKQYLATWELMHEALTSVGGTGQAEPRVGTSWRNKDPQTWEFKLAPNLKFHSGEPFNADSVVFMVGYLNSDEGKGTPLYGSLRHVVGATKVDDMTVEIKTAGPSPILPSEIAALRFMDPKVWRDLGKQGYGNKPSGLGPWRVTNWDETKVELTRFDGSLRKAKIDNVLMYFMPESPTRVQAFQSNAADIALYMSSDARGLIEGAGGRLANNPSPSVIVSIFNQSKGGITLDKRVRQALNYAVDKSYTETLLGGNTIAASQPATRSVNGYQADIKPYAYDPAKAKALLTEAGFGNGLKILAEVLNTEADNNNVYQHVVNNLQKVGVDMELRIMTTPDLNARITGGKVPEGPMMHFNYGSAPSIDMMRPVNTYHSCKFPRGWTCFQEIEPTIEAVNTEFDPKKRAEGLRKISQYYHETAPALWLYDAFELDAIAKRVKSYKNENWRLNWADIELQG